MAIAYNTSSNVTWLSNATTKNVDISAMATGSVCYCLIQLTATQASPTTAITFTGWTRISENDFGVSRHYGWFYRVKVGGDTTFAASWPTTTLGTILVGSYTGVDTSSPHEGAIYLEHTANNANFVSGSVTPTQADRWITMFAFKPQGGTTSTFTPDAAMTERADVANGGGSGANVTTQLADTNGAVTAAAHTYTSVSSNATQRGGVVALALNPAAASTPSDTATLFKQRRNFRNSMMTR